MSSVSNTPNSLIEDKTTTRSLWVTLEPVEVIELKRIAIDGDTDSAINFFLEVLAPRVREASLKRGMALDLSAED